MKANRFIQAAIVTLVLGVASIASATSLRQRDVEVEGVHQEVIWLRRGFTMTLTATAMDENVDPELDVFAYPGGNFLARQVSWEEHPAVVSATSSDLRLTVIIRGQAGTAPGAVNFQISVRDATRQVGSSSQVVEVEPVSDGSHFTVPGTLQTGAHVLTAEQQDGPEDTVLLVYPAPNDENPAAPLQFDDDNGVAAASWMHLSKPCGSSIGCAIVVGRRTNVLDHSQVVKRTIQRSGKATVIVDNKIHTLDTDHDGLSDELEAQLQSNPRVADTDGDGLLDGFEVIGKDSPQHLLTSRLKFAYYGADILKKDLFIEAHWQSPCNPALPTCDFTLRDSNRPNAATADELARIYGLIGINVHMDNGVRRIGSTVSGDWGGSGFVLPWGRAFRTFCEVRSAERNSYFYNIVTPGMTTPLCSLVPADDASTMAHEIGHGFGLDHGGPKNSTHDNCKPNYPSVMNYATQRSGIFSRGLLGVLNPQSVEEAVGLGTTNTAQLDIIQGLYGRKVDRTTGGIDWDMDGVIAPPGKKVRAWLNYAFSDCDMGAPNRRDTASFMRGGPPALTDEGGVPVVYSVGRVRFNSGPVIMRVSGNLSRCQQATTNVDASCATFFGASATIPSSMTPSEVLSPAAVRGMVVAADTTGRLFAFVPGGRTGGWIQQKLSLPLITGDPIAIESDSIVSVYAPSGNTLNRWDFDRRFGIWVTQGATVRWENIDPVFTRTGIGVTNGFQSDVAGPAIYAAVKQAFVRVPDPASPDVKFTDIDVARIIRTVTRPPFLFGLPGPAQVNEHWRLVPSMRISPAGDQTADGQRVSLAYLPFPGEAPESGRFYCTFRDTGPNGNPQMTATRGNRPPMNPADDVRTLTWVPGNLFNNEWTGAVLRKIYLAPVGGQLRGAGQSGATSEPSSVTFFPNADGVYNHNQLDHDDVTSLHANFACSLRANCH
jgi:hypothetical protein